MSQSNERNVYLNLMFEDTNDEITQTQCINIANEDSYFEISS
jgi:hypothetical protein